MLLTKWLSTPTTVSSNTKAFPEAALQRCSLENLFWKYAANWQENIHAEMWLQQNAVLQTYVCWFIALPEAFIADSWNVLKRIRTLVWNGLRFSSLIHNKHISRAYFITSVTMDVVFGSKTWEKLLCKTTPDSRSKTTPDDLNWICIRPLYDSLDVIWMSILHYILVVCPLAEE